MNLFTLISGACDGIAIHTQTLDLAIAQHGFATQDSYSAVSLEVAERRLREAADRIRAQRAQLAANEPMLEAAE